MALVKRILAVLVFISEVMWGGVRSYSASSPIFHVSAQCYHLGLTFAGGGILCAVLSNEGFLSLFILRSMLSVHPDASASS